MTITEKVAYLKGMADGLNLDTEKSKEGKLISIIIDVLEEVGMSIEDLEETATAMGEEIDAISDDLADVEELLEEDEDDEDEEEMVGGCCGRGGHGHGGHGGHHGHGGGHHGHGGGCCGGGGHHHDEEEEDFFEVECPNCKEDLVIDEAVLEAGVVECDNCHEKYALEISGDHDGGCGCGCEDEDEEA